MNRDDICDLLDAMQARCDNATPGPWEYLSKNVFDTPVIDISEANWGGEGLHGYRLVAWQDSGAWRNEDAEFIAAARQDLPRLIAAVRAVLERIAAMERDGHSLRLHDHTRAAGTALIDAAYSLRTALSADRIEQGDQP